MVEKSKGLHPPGFPSEAAKIREKVMPYIVGAEKVYDYGCGDDKIVPWAKGVDIRGVKNVEIVTRSPEDVYDIDLKMHIKNVDVVFSSHFLEHVKDDNRLLKTWIRQLKPSGFLILYLPDDNYYDNDSNPEHLQRYVYESFIKRFSSNFSDQMKLIAHGPDVGDDRYSFYLVAQKLESQDHDQK